MRKPRPLCSGDRVALVAPAGAFDPERLETGSELLTSWGLVVEPPASARPHRYMGASDGERIRELTSAFERPDIRAVLPVRGGYGCARLVAGLDTARIARDPKLLVGFSDVSLLLLRLVEEAGLVCYHGPMVAADLPALAPEAQERFRRFLFGEKGWFDGSARECWRPARASGRLVGGCLSVLTTTLGTPYELATEGRVLFLEDVAESPYRIDRMLTQLAHAGKFEQVAAVVFGAMLDRDGGEDGGELREIALEALAGTRCPIIYGVDAGHGSNNVVLPMGCEVSVDAEARVMELCEPAFAE